MNSGLKVYLHVTVFSPCPLLPPLKLSIRPMVTVWIIDRMGDWPIYSLRCSDDNKKNTFNNGVNNRHGLKMLCVNRPWNLYGFMLGSFSIKTVKSDWSVHVTVCNYSNLSTPSLCLRMRRLELISSLSTKVLSSQRTVSSEPEMVNPFRPCKTRVLSKLTVSPAKCDIEMDGTEYVRGVKWVSRVLALHETVGDYIWWPGSNLDGLN